MKLLPKRKMVSVVENQPVIETAQVVKQIQQTTIDEMTLTAKKMAMKWAIIFH